MNRASAQDDKRALWQLGKVPLLAALPTHELERLAQRATFGEAKRRKVFYIPGDPAASLYFVIGGRVKISKVTRDGKELTLAYRGPGDLFGELCLVEAAAREEMAEAVENAIVAAIEANDFAALLDRDAPLGHRLAQVLVERRRELERKLERLVFRDVHEKVAELLLDLASSYGVTEARGVLIAFKITHQEMANIIGSTRETVSLTLSEFRRQQLIDFEGRRVVVTNPEALRTLIA